MSVFTKMGFEEWSALASDDPQAFEQLRERVINDFFDSIPSEQRLPLRRLQWRIDQIRSRSSNPMSATINLYSMMWDHLAGDGGMLEMLDNLKQPMPASAQASLKSAKILTFRPRPG
jgi:hypothetical protein